MTFESGQKIGAYRIVRLFGEGGMGAVYEVEHEQLGVRYALKAFTCESGYVDILKKNFCSLCPACRRTDACDIISADERSPYEQYDLSDGSGV